MKKAITFILSIILVFAISAPAFAAGAGCMNQAQERGQSQSNKQTEVNSTECERARLQIRDRLQLSDQAVLRYQERLQLQEKSGLCFCDTQKHCTAERASAAHCWC